MPGLITDISNAVITNQVLLDGQVLTGQNDGGPSFGILDVAWEYVSCYLVFWHRAGESHYPQPEITNEEEQAVSMETLGPRKSKQ